MSSNVHNNNTHTIYSFTMELIDRISHIDRRLLLRLANSYRLRTLLPFIRAISKTGDGYLQVILPLSIFFSKGLEGTVTLIKVTTLAFCIERSLYWVLKNTLKRQRPPQVIPSFRASITASDEFSFPSGHTSAAFLLATIIYLYHPLGIILYVWAGLVGCSRVILGVHFPIDIFAGAMLGSSIGWAIWSVF